jgi:hypothetical protein
VRNRKEFIPGTFIFVTFRTEEGLPFVALPFMNMLLESAIARAQKLYPVVLCGYTFEPNHAHLTIRVTDPELVPNFIGYVKAEAAHYLNRLLGRKQHSVWAERYDSPPVLDLAKALQKFAYGLLNPVKDRLEAEMLKYPGVSSYQLLRERKETKLVRDIPRSKVPKLKDPRRPYRENHRMVEYFGSDEFEEIEIHVDPTAMRLCFEKSRQATKEEFYDTLCDYIDLAEAGLRKERGSAPVLGAKRLQQASILATHTPPSNGRRMICLGSNGEERAAFIRRFRALHQRCREVLERWRLGYTWEPFPPGMFPPSQPRMANVVPSFVL